jgi:hypothetical protein
VASERGGYDAHYSDHLRHMASARALAAHGFDVYRRPYAEVTEGLRPCPAHAGLFDDRTAPYPPLGLLLHWPLAELEARGVLAPAWAHRLQTLFSLWAGLAAAALALTLLRRREDVAGLALVLTPLLLGAGANGFYDTFYVAAGVGALACLCAKRPLAALALLVVAAGSSFRALALAPLAVSALLALFRRHGAKAFAAGALGALLVLPAIAAGVTVASTLEQIPAHNPLHLSHLLEGRPRPLLLAALALGGAAVLARHRKLLAAACTLAAWAVTLSDRSYGYWHALPLCVPWLVFVVEAAPDETRARWVALAALLVALALGYLNPLEVSWGWLWRQGA